MKVLLFDIDGTLIATGGAGKRSFIEALRLGFNVEAATDEVPFAGQTDPAIVRAYFDRHGIELSSRNVHIFYEHYLSRLQQNMVNTQGRAMPGVHEILAQCGNGLHAHVKVGLLTGNIEAGARIKLERFDLWRFFSFGAFGSDHESREQIARLARDRAIQKFGTHLRATDFIVIGDTPRDVQCGKTIGARTVAVATGPHSEEELQAFQPSLVLRNLSRSADFLNWINRD